MKNKFIGFFILFAILSVFNSYGYELVDERLTITPECIGGVSYCVIESGFLSSLSDFMVLHPEAGGCSIDKEFLDYLTSIAGCGSSAGARAYPAEGRKDSNVMLSSDHSYYLCNDTNEHRQFKVKTKLSTHDYHSSEHEQLFLLKPKEYVRTSKYLYLNKCYSGPGLYNICASTDISLSSSSSASDTARVTIR